MSLREELPARGQSWAGEESPGQDPVSELSDGVQHEGSGEFHPGHSMDFMGSANLSLTPSPVPSPHSESPSGQDETGPAPRQFLAEKPQGLISPSMRPGGVEGFEVAPVDRVEVAIVGAREGKSAFTARAADAVQKPDSTPQFQPSFATTAPQSFVNGSVTLTDAPPSLLPQEAAGSFDEPTPQVAAGDDSGSLAPSSPSDAGRHRLPGGDAGPQDVKEDALRDQDADASDSRGCEEVTRGIEVVRRGLPEETQVGHASDSIPHHQVKPLPPSEAAQGGGSDAAQGDGSADLPSIIADASLDPQRIESPHSDTYRQHDQEHNWSKPSEPDAEAAAEAAVNSLNLQTPRPHATLRDEAHDYELRSRERAAAEKAWEKEWGAHPTWIPAPALASRGSPSRDRPRVIPKELANVSPRYFDNTDKQIREQKLRQQQQQSARAGARRSDSRPKFSSSPVRRPLDSADRSRPSFPEAPRISQRHSSAPRPARGRAMQQAREGYSVTPERRGTPSRPTYSVTPPKSRSPGPGGLRVVPLGRSSQTHTHRSTPSQRPHSFSLNRLRSQNAQLLAELDTLRRRKDEDRAKQVAVYRELNEMRDKCESFDKAQEAREKEEYRRRMERLLLSEEEKRREKDRAERARQEEAEDRERRKRRMRGQLSTEEQYPPLVHFALEGALAASPARERSSSGDFTGLPQAPPRSAPVPRASGTVTQQTSSGVPVHVSSGTVKQREIADPPKVHSRPGRLWK
eukprot:Hpha_TRINITY_DN16061_c0_g1::TRINITY_DN16061_c0_g1_i1::g.119525::m.119525